MTDSLGSEQESEPTIWELLRTVSLLVILLLAFLGGLGIGGASPALPGIATEFGIGEARIGLVMTAFTLGAFVMLPFTGILMDIYGRRPTVLVLMFLYGAAGTGVIFAQGFTHILVLRFVQGIGFIGTYPLTIALIGDLYAGVTGSTAQGLRSSAIGLAQVVVPGVAGFLAGIAWQLPFGLNALGFVALILAYFYLPETSSLSPSNRSGWPTTIRDAGETVQSSLSGFIVGLRHPTIAVLLGSVLLIYLARMVLLTYVPLYAVRSLETSYVVAGIALSLTGIGQFIISPFAGVVQERIQLRTAFIGTIVTIASGIILVGVIDSVVWLYGMLLLYGIGNALFQPILNNTITDLAADTYRARVVSILEMTKTGAITISPVVFGVVLATVGFESMFIIAGTLAVLPVIPIYFVIRQ